MRGHAAVAMRALALMALLLPVLLLPVLPARAALLDWSDDERERIAAHGPWPVARAADPSNRVDGRPEAVALGRRLFFDPALSASGRTTCASCHRPGRAFQDGLPASRHGRNTPSLLDAGTHRWYGWDGAHDNLWSASLGPLVAADEIGATPASVLARVRDDRDWQALFGVPVADERLLVDAAKALAAYQATLVSARTPFDDFRDALQRGDARAAARYPLAAQRGLRLFVGEGRCHLCHAGPAFSNGEFADAGVRHFRAGGVDPGRWRGLERLLASRSNRLGPFADRADGSEPTRHVVMEPRHFGEFRVPGLRQLVHTAPYFHDGSARTIDDVVRHYSELDPERLHAEGVALLRPLKLSKGQAADLAAFLRSLSAPSARPRPAPAARPRGSVRSPRRRGRRRGSVRCRTVASGCARCRARAAGSWGRGRGAPRS